MKRNRQPGWGLVLLIACASLATTASAATLKVMTTGLGTGTVSGPSGFSCTSSGGAACTTTFTTPVTLTTANGPNSSFAGWEGDCTGMTCTVPAGADASVRARFNLTISIPTITDFTPAGLITYLNANPDVDSPARFLRALPQDFRQNWILMSRSESLQTGIAQLPRILLPSEDGRFVFTFGLRQHSAYPGAHPNAIEYMQWDATQKTFRFHEIVLAPIPALSNTLPPGSPRTPRVVVAARTRSVSTDDARCFQCHSTRNVLSRNSVPGTTGVPPGLVPWKNKPNWDTYDSWGGMLPFNRDRIYKGSVEAAAFRKLFNLWTWNDNHAVRSFIEQLELQPSTITIPTAHAITRHSGGPNDGHIIFGFDPPPTIVTNEPEITGLPTEMISYSFNGVAGTSASSVFRGGDFVTLHHSRAPADDEGRGVEFFDLLGGAGSLLSDGTSFNLFPNQLRIADEVNRHRFATGSVPIDVRPVTLAITKGCLTLATLPSLTVDRSFFDQRNGLTITQIVEETQRLMGSPESRPESMPRRKADIEKLNLDRTNDPYLVLPENGLIQQYGATTFLTTSTADSRLRQEVFRRPLEGFSGDSTVMGGFYVDREAYGQNTEKVALYRYFLEPLGVSVDKWSMGVRGRSRTYTFADVFFTYTSTFTTEIQNSLIAEPVVGLTPALAPPFSCSALMTAVNSTLGTGKLPAVNAVPTYTDVQRILNKACIECHGGLGYPPFDVIFDADYLDLSEDETAATSRLTRSHTRLVTGGFTTTNPATSYLYQRITEGGEKCPDSTASPAPRMPCGGPWLSQADVLTIRRWIQGPPSRPSTVGDPHIKTVDGTNYDFQSAGEFVLLRGEGIEVQTRQTPVQTQTPLGPNAHTGLSSCVSINTAAAFRIGPHRISYQPSLGERDASGLRLRVDGKLTSVGSGVVLSGGGRILPTTAPGGIQIEYPGGTDIIVTPGFWDLHQVWYMNIDVRHARATEGVMGVIAPGNWLPALPDGTFLGPRPTDVLQRYQDLYVTFANAWRVTDSTSLFDYTKGTSTRTFTLEAWPGESPQTCLYPPEVPRPPQPPIQPLPLAVAKQHCARLVELDRRAHCEQDVMVTGDPGFAETYLRTEAIVLNALPAVPVLLFPDKNKTDLATTFDFSWNKTTDTNKDRLTYLQCVWAAGEPFTFNACKELPQYVTMLDGYNPNLLLLILLILLLMFLFLLFRFKKIRLLLLLLILVLLFAAFFVFRFGRATTLSHEVAGLKPGQVYFWKVIAQDGKGGTIESETRRFATKK